MLRDAATLLNGASGDVLPTASISADLFEALERNPKTRGTPVDTVIGDPCYHWHPRIDRTPLLGVEAATRRRRGARLPAPLRRGPAAGDGSVEKLTRPVRSAARHHELGA